MHDNTFPRKHKPPPARGKDHHNITVPTAQITMPAEFLERSRRHQIMLARIKYAARGWETFPAVIGRNGEKKSLKSEAQFGTKWGKTLDEEIIRKEFTQHKFRDQIIGLPTGIESGIIVVDSDTAEHGKDGEAALKKWERRHGKLPDTLEAESPSGSRHRYFKHPGAGIKVKSFANILGEGSGVDVRGDNGMVLAPPSHIAARPAINGKPAKVGGVYRWLNDHEIAEAPQALLDLIIEKKPPEEKTRKSKATGNERNEFQKEGDKYNPQADKAEVAFALDQIPLTISYDIWMEIGAAIADEFGDVEGRKILEPWSMQSKDKYNPRTFAKKWKDFLAMTEFGIGTVFHYADLYNPKWCEEWALIQLGVTKQKSKTQQDNKKSKTEKKKSKTTSDDNVDEADDDAVSPIIAKPFVLRDPKTIPRRDWLYGRLLIRQFAAATIAAGGVGKSSVMLVRALALATGRPLLGVRVKKPVRVWYWCGEDPYEEIERRIAAICLHYNIKASEIAGRLFINSGRIDQIKIAVQTRKGTVVVAPMIEALHETIVQNKIDVVMIDPFVSTHQVTENDNSAIEMVARAWTQLADATNTAIGLAHHIRKTDGSSEVTVEDARGAKALIDAVRSSEVLIPMSKEDGGKAGVPHRSYFKIIDGKMNLAPANDKSDWYHLKSVDLGNGPPRKEIEEGDKVGVVICWDWPDPLDGIKKEDFEKVADEIKKGKWRANPQAKFWVGHAVAKALGLDLRNKANKAKIVGLVRAWLQAKKLIEVGRMDEARRETKMFVEIAAKD